jgi:hypothetical protein
MLMVAWDKKNPAPDQKRQCRFMLFIRLREGIVSHFKDLKRTGYYRGDRYTDREPEMLRNLVKMLDKRLSMYDRIELYDNDKTGEERIVLKITDGCIERNDMQLYSLMLTNYLLPKWLKK